jgi:hypothetical protein
LELRVPQDRAGRFSTALFERYQRSEKALVAALAEMYVQGVSTRKVKAITEELCESRSATPRFFGFSATSLPTFSGGHNPTSCPLHGWKSPPRKSVVSQPGGAGACRRNVLSRRVT